MYACICKAVPESAVRACHEAGLRDLRQVSEVTRAGSGCGSCVTRLRAILHTAGAVEPEFAGSGA